MPDRRKLTEPQARVLRVLAALDRPDQGRTGNHTDEPGHGHTVHAGAADNLVGRGYAALGRWTGTVYVVWITDEGRAKLRAHDDPGPGPRAGLAFQEGEREPRCGCHGAPLVLCPG